jgi:hypothetical protein
MTAAAPAFKQQNWGDDLRLPTFTTPSTELYTDFSAIRQTPIPFQSKHLPALKRDVWFALQRPADRSRMGALCVWPAQKCCVYISGDAKGGTAAVPRMAILRLRVDPQFFADGTGLTVFAATLSPSAHRLWVEDVLMWKGRNVWATETFRDRWCLAAQWLEHYCIVDGRLMDGVELALGRWQPLDQVRPEGVWILQSDEAGRRGLLWIANQKRVEEANTVANIDQEVVSSPRPVASAPALEVGSLIAQAARESGPDQWRLAAADGSVLGRALIRRLEVSSALRSVGTDSCLVEVEWNDVFKKWEIRGLAPAGVVGASDSSFFGITK